MTQLARSLILAIGLCASWVLCLAGCNPPSGGGASQPAEPSQPKIGLRASSEKLPNVLVVVVDTLRADKLAAYGHAAGLSPTTDAIALEGMVFNRAQAVAPWTLPSIGSMFVSHYPSVHGAVSYEDARDTVKGRKQAEVPMLAEEFQTLAETLHDGGYQTVAVSGNPFVQRILGFGQGFDDFEGKEFADNTAHGSKVNAAVVKWLEAGRKPDKPFLMYVHYMDVHGPYDAPPQFMEPLLRKVEALPAKRPLTPREMQRLIPYLNVPPPDLSDPGLHDRLRGYLEYWIARYEAGILEFESYFAELVGEFQKRGLWDELFVVVTADHGEAFLEHGFWDHGYSQYQEELHVPLIFRWKGKLPAGARVRDTVRLLDVYPTLVEQLGLTNNHKLQGVSLVDIMSGNSPPTPLIAYSESRKTAGGLKNMPQFAVVYGDWKLVRTRVIGPGADGQPTVVRVANELYDLSKDPREQLNLATVQPQQTKLLADMIENQIRINAQTKPGLVVPKQTTDASKLQGLGYVGGSNDEKDDAPASQPASSP